MEGSLNRFWGTALLSLLNQRALKVGRGGHATARFLEGFLEGSLKEVPS